MSALIVPAIVGVGGVFLLYKALTKKKKPVEKDEIS